MKTSVLAFVFAATATYAQTSPHGSLRLACATCHTTDSWEVTRDARFDHATVGFRLTGQHANVRCTSCHKVLTFKGAPTACASCHMDVHRSELGIECLTCHSTQSWVITDMRQKHQRTAFPLTGSHLAVACDGCHENAREQQYRATPLTCSGCHREDYLQTRNPDHQGAGFSMDCVQCHSMTAMHWGGSFNHSITRFPLTGAHRATTCISCHENQVFKGIATACLACHRDEYLAVADPSHVGLNFPTTCELCHSTVAWENASFDHNQSRFPLTGAHARQTCVSCHFDNVYTGKSTECVSCHRDQYTSAQNPNHLANGFPEQCQQCHSTSAWQPSTFNHDQAYFRIYSGKHRNKWSQCAQCHPTPGAFVDFTCLTCHEHRQSAMDSKHSQVNGYSYSSPACYTCHRNV